jgi:hypothetical protein
MTRGSSRLSSPRSAPLYTRIVCEHETQESIHLLDGEKAPSRETFGHTVLVRTVAKYAFESQATVPPKGGRKTVRYRVVF